MQEKKDEYEKRIEKLQQQLQAEETDGAIFFHPEEIFYFTGSGVHSVLLVPSHQPPILLVRINFERGKKDSYIADIRPSQGMNTLIDVIEEVYGEKKVVLGLSFDVTTLQFYSRLKKSLPQATFVDVQKIVWSLRLIKSNWEVSQMKNTALISRKGFEQAIEALQEGMTEIQFLKTIEKITSSYGDEGNMIQRGSSNRLPFGVVAFGENTSVISGNWLTMTGSGSSPSRPYGAGNRKIAQGDLVVIDKGTVSKGYHVDEARTFVFGKANQKQKELHKIVNEILDHTIESIRPGKRVADIYSKAEEIAFSYDLNKEFMGLGQYGFKYVGHGVGLEMDEPPLVSSFNEMILEPGMVLAIEPKVIFPNQFGLTIEDTVLVTETGVEILTSSSRDTLEI